MEWRGDLRDGGGQASEPTVEGMGTDRDTGIETEGTGREREREKGRPARQTQSVRESFSPCSDPTRLRNRKSTGVRQIVPVADRRKIKRRNSDHNSVRESSEEEFVGWTNTLACLSKRRNGWPRLTGNAAITSPSHWTVVSLEPNALSLVSASRWSS